MVQSLTPKKVPKSYSKMGAAELVSCLVSRCIWRYLCELPLELPQTSAVQTFFSFASSELPFSRSNPLLPNSGQHPFLQWSRCSCMGLQSGPLQMVLETHVSEEMRGDEVILGGWEVGLGIGGRVVGVWGWWGGRG